ncbi:NTP transferase domain-containing protein [bacterium]|nr:NTP transferase domain-containing protein [bacterium]
MKWDVVLFAGGECPESLRERTGERYRALISLQGRPVVLPAVRAFLDLRPAAKIEIYGPEEELRDALLPHIGEERLARIGFLPIHPGGLAGGVADAVARREAETRLILAAADLPLLRLPGVISFLKMAEHCRGIAYPVIPRGTLDSALARSSTFLRTRDGQFTGGNLLAAKAGDFAAAVRFVGPVIANRKSPLAIARLFGARFLIGLLLGRWRLEEIADRLEEVMGVRLTPVVTTAFGMGVDLDKLSDYLVFQELLDAPKEEQGGANPT